MTNELEALCYKRPESWFGSDGHKFWILLCAPTNGKAMINALSTAADLTLNAAQFAAVVNRKYRRAKLMDMEISRRAE